MSNPQTVKDDIEARLIEFDRESQESYEGVDLVFACHLVEDLRDEVKRLKMIIKSYEDANES